jgi:hypothetical protein
VAPLSLHPGGDVARGGEKGLRREVMTGIDR